MNTAPTVPVQFGARACAAGRGHRTALPLRLLDGLLLLLLPGLAAGAGLPVEKPRLNPNAEADGRALVAELLARQPTQNRTNSGVLSVRPARGAGLRRELPLTVRVFVTPDGWVTQYEVAPSGSEPPIRLTILRRPGQPNDYRLVEGAPAIERRLDGAAAMTPFAGSDFWVADLGAEFLHWPTQRLVRREARRGQACDVLESVAPAGQTNGYARVTSWIDRDTGGIVFAEAFDSSGRLMREFAPKSFKKVGGCWEVEEVEIMNQQTGSRTRLRLLFAEP